MKKKIALMFLCIFMFCTLTLPVSAKSPLVLDYANLMTSGETQYLEEWSSRIHSEYGLDVVVLTVPSLMGTSAQDFADDFYENNGYAENGLLFLVDMGSRQWHISTSGTAIDSLSDRDLMQIEDRVIPYFSDGRYYDGFCRFLDILPDYLVVESDSGVNVLLSLALGAVIAGIVILIMRSTMNTKKPQRSAVNYEVDGSYQLRMNQDIFLYTNISKRAKPQNNSSGSSTHRSSSGRSHGGRGSRF